MQTALEIISGILILGFIVSNIPFKKKKPDKEDKD